LVEIDSQCIKYKQPIDIRFKEIASWLTAKVKTAFFNKAVASSSVNLTKDKRNAGIHGAVNCAGPRFLTGGEETMFSL
jgi:hypothetical protein